MALFVLGRSCFLFRHLRTIFRVGAGLALVHGVLVS